MLRGCGLLVLAFAIGWVVIKLAPILIPVVVGLVVIGAIAALCSRS